MWDLVGLLHCLQGGRQKDRKGLESLEEALGFPLEDKKLTTCKYGKPDPGHQVFTACSGCLHVFLLQLCPVSGLPLSGRQRYTAVFPPSESWVCLWVPEFLLMLPSLMLSLS